MEYILPATWGDGVSAPGFYISGIRTLTVKMPDVLETPVPVFSEGRVKKSKYTGRIHKAVDGTSFTIAFRWVLCADEPVLHWINTRIPGYNYLDVIHLIHATDNAFDSLGAAARLQFISHVPNFDRLPLGGFGIIPGGDHGAFLYNFRLASPPKIETIRAVAKIITLEVETDGFAERLPYNTALAPFMDMI